MHTFKIVYMVGRDIRVRHVDTESEGEAWEYAESLEGQFDDCEIISVTDQGEKVTQ